MHLQIQPLIDEPHTRNLRVIMIFGLSSTGECRYEYDET